MEEIWEPVVGYEKSYLVSNTGLVKSIDRIIERNGIRQHKKGKMLSIRNNKFGYKRVKLSAFGKDRLFMVHRLVAEAFIPNPDNLPFINHKDEDKSNNNFENLEWCTRLYNTRYGTNIERMRLSHINNPKLSKKVAKCSLSGEILESYPSIAEAARANGLHGAKISCCCLGKPRRKTHGGFIWKFI